MTLWFLVLFICKLNSLSIHLCVKLYPEWNDYDCKTRTFSSQSKTATPIKPSNFLKVSLVWDNRINICSKNNIDATQIREGIYQIHPFVRALQCSAWPCMPFVLALKNRSESLSIMGPKIKLEFGRLIFFGKSGIIFVQAARNCVILDRSSASMWMRLYRKCIYLDTITLKITNQMLIQAQLMCFCKAFE